MKANNMLEVIVHEKSTGGTYDCIVLINGQEVDGQDVSAHLFPGTGDGEIGISLFIRKYEYVEGLYSLHLNQILPQYNFLTIRATITCKFERLPFDARITLMMNKYFDVWSMAANVAPVIEDWKLPWSQRQFAQEAQELIYKQELLSKSFLAPERLAFDAGFIFSMSTLQSPITLESVINDLINVIEHDLSIITESLSRKTFSNSIVKSFNFPEEVRVSCEQYLLYFIQFLKDLGLEANAEIKHEANRVLFSVTPSDGVEALEKVREALDIYLQLPTRINSSDLMSLNADMEVQRLSANILHLNSQIILAQAVIQQKDATIEAKEETIRQLRGQIFLESERALPSKEQKKDKEDVLGGAVSIKPYDAKFAEINLPVIFRKLRERFSRKTLDSQETKQHSD